MPNNKQYLDRVGLVQVWNKIKSGFYSKTEIDTLLANKQNNITAGNGITINRGSENDTISIEDGVIFNCGTSTTVI